MQSGSNSHRQLPLQRGMLPYVLILRILNGKFWLLISRLSLSPMTDRLPSRCANVVWVLSPVSPKRSGQ